jgi:hypothetical protein
MVIVRTVFNFSPTLDLASDLYLRRQSCLLSGDTAIYERKRYDKRLCGVRRTLHGWQRMQA